MNIIVSKDIVKLNENHSENHYGEYNVNECVFEFDEYFDSVPIKKAIFTSQSNNKSFEIDIINNKCTVPHEVLTKVYDTVILGVYGYDVNEETLLVRYSPEPTTFVVHEGSYKEGAEQPEIITPTQYDMFSKALQEGLAEVDKRLDDVEKQGDYASEQGDYAKEQGDYAKSEGDNAKSVAEETQKKAQEGAFDGKSLEFVWEGTKLGVRLEGQEEYQFVDLQGKQGEIGATGEPFKIKKTYASVSEMNADFRNMAFGDYVMIASSVEVEDNAKLYTRGESAWIFISDFSGAMGIRGETGLTPNIKIGEVKTLEAGSQAKVTRSGSNEEPVFNFELPKGDKGDNYVLTEEDKVEIGEKVNTEYEERIAENEKYILDLEATIDILTNTDKKRGELVHITDALPLPTFETTADGNVEQETTKGKNKLPSINTSQTINGITFTKNNDGTVTANGTATDNAVYPLNNEGTTLVDNLNINSGNYKLIDSVGDYTNYFTQLYYNNSTDGSKFINTGTSAASNFTVSENSIGRAILYIRNGVTVNNLTFKPMLLLVSETDETYEKFTNGASPNPEYPQEIEVIEGDLSYKVNGKNLFNIDKVTTGKFIDSNGELLSNPNWNSYLIPIKVFPNTKYILSRNENEIDKYQFVIAEYDKNGQMIKYNSYYNTGTFRYKITTTENTSFVYLGYREDFQHTDIQFELGDTRTNYEPYQEQIVPLDLKGNWVGAINDNIRDYLVTDKKKYWLVKNVGKVVLDGSENWTITAPLTNTNAYYLQDNIGAILTGKNNTLGICSHLIGNQDGYSTDNECWWFNQNGLLRLRMNINNLEEFKTWLSTHNVEVYYQLATPQIIELDTLEEPISTFEGVNNIQLLANLDTEIEVVYALDVKKYYDNKLAEISAQII